MMGIWKGREPVAVERTVPLRDVVMVETPEAAALEQTARHREVLRMIRRGLLAEAAKDPGVRNDALVDWLLDARSVLLPSEPDPEALAERPVSLRSSVPVIPGRTS